MTMKKIVNVKADEVFSQLSTGDEVYSFCIEDKSTENVKHETVDDLLAMIENDVFVFFKIVESEE